MKSGCHSNMLAGAARSAVHTIGGRVTARLPADPCRSSASASASSSNAVQKPDERVVLVDEQNNVLGTTSRRAMRETNAIHRCSFVLIFDSGGRLYVQKRVPFKETYPGFYDPAPGGVVGEEGYEANAEREIEEEMGVQGVQLHHCLDFFFADQLTRHWGRLFWCRYNGPFKLDPEEVESGEFMQAEAVKKLLIGGQVTPDSKLGLETWLEERGGQLSPPQ